MVPMSNLVKRGIECQKAAMILAALLSCHPGNIWDDLATTAFMNTTGRSRSAGIIVDWKGHLSAIRLKKCACGAYAFPLQTNTCFDSTDKLADLF